MKDSFVFSADFAKAASTLGDKARLKLYDAIVEMGLAENDEELERIWDEIGTKLVQNRNVFAQVLLIKERFLRSGKHGGKREGAGAPAHNKNAVKKNNQNNQVIVFENNQDKQKEKIPLIIPLKENTPPNSLKGVSPQKFKKPTVDEVEEYCAERHNGVNAEQFCDFYESKGWKVGKTPMKDWQAAVRTWEKREPAPPDTGGGMSDADIRAATAEADLAEAMKRRFMQEAVSKYGGI